MVVEEWREGDECQDDVECHGWRHKGKGRVEWCLSLSAKTASKEVAFKVDIGLPGRRWGR